MLGNVCIDNQHATHLESLNVTVLARGIVVAVSGIGHIGTGATRRQARVTAIAYADWPGDISLRAVKQCTTDGYTHCPSDCAQSPGHPVGDVHVVVGCVCIGLRGPVFSNGVIPAKAGISLLAERDSRFRGNDAEKGNRAVGDRMTWFHEIREQRG